MRPLFSIMHRAPTGERFDSRLHNVPPPPEDQSYRSNRPHRFQRFRNRTPTRPAARESAPPARPIRTAHPKSSLSLRQPRQPAKNGPPRAHRYHRRIARIKKTDSSGSGRGRRPGRRGGLSRPGSDDRAGGDQEHVSNVIREPFRKRRHRLGRRCPLRGWLGIRMRIRIRIRIGRLWRRRWPWRPRRLRRHRRRARPRPDRGGAGTRRHRFARIGIDQSRRVRALAEQVQGVQGPGEPPPGSVLIGAEQTRGVITRIDDAEHRHPLRGRIGAEQALLEAGTMPGDLAIRECQEADPVVAGGHVDASRSVDVIESK